MYHPNLENRTVSVHAYLLNSNSPRQYNRIAFPAIIRPERTSRLVVHVKTSHDMYNELIAMSSDTLSDL